LYQFASISVEKTSIETCPLCFVQVPLGDFADHVHRCLLRLDEEEDRKAAQRMVENDPTLTTTLDGYAQGAFSAGRDREDVPVCSSGAGCSSFSERHFMVYVHPLAHPRAIATELNHPICACCGLHFPEPMWDTHQTECFARREAEQVARRADADATRLAATGGARGLGSGWPRLPTTAERVNLNEDDEDVDEDEDGDGMQPGLAAPSNATFAAASRSVGAGVSTSTSSSSAATAAVAARTHSSVWGRAGRDDDDDDDEDEDARLPPVATSSSSAALNFTTPQIVSLANMALRVKNENADPEAFHRLLQQLEGLGFTEEKLRERMQEEAASRALGSSGAAAPPPPPPPPSHE
jgi:hypothetical protein